VCGPRAVLHTEVLSHMPEVNPSINREKTAAGSVLLGQTPACRQQPRAGVTDDHPPDRMVFDFIARDSYLAESASISDARVELNNFPMHLVDELWINVFHKQVSPGTSEVPHASPIAQVVFDIERLAVGGES
jgi:hypothetical protein